MEKKNPFSEASKERRRLLNERNSAATKKNVKDVSSAQKRNKVKDQLVDLSSKDQISPKGLYV